MNSNDDDPQDDEPADGSSIDPQATSRPVDDIYAAAYEELRRRASAALRRDPNAAISTGTLVHEAFLKIYKRDISLFESKEHLINTIARAMRQVLVDLARYRLADMRTGIELPIDDTVPLASTPVEDTLDLDAALRDLETLDPELAKLVQLHYFGGSSLAEIAEMRGVSESTVRRQIAIARARLKAFLNDRRQKPE